MRFIAIIGNTGVETDKRLILASNSPRRRELLGRITSDFVVIPSNFDEQLREGVGAIEYVLACAKGKAEDVFRGNCGDIVLAADTIVVLGDRILLKPQDEKEAFDMLSALGGGMHSVYTAVCMRAEGVVLLEYEKASVEFAKFKSEDILQYIGTGSPFDKAGGYGIQDEWIKERVERIEGNVDNIIGLPATLVKKMIKGVY